MSPYTLIFINSLQSSLLLSLRSENAWIAALSFGSYDMRLATALALAGSVLGMTINYLFGYYASRWRTELPSYDDEIYQRICWHFRTYGFLLMAFPPLPYLDALPWVVVMTYFVVLNGAFRVPPGRALLAIALGRALYYAYYLMH